MDSIFGSEAGEFVEGGNSVANKSRKTFIVVEALEVAAADHLLDDLIQDLLRDSVEDGFDGLERFRFPREEEALKKLGDLVVSGGVAIDFAPCGFLALKAVCRC